MVSSLKSERALTYCAFLHTFAGKGVFYLLVGAYFIGIANVKDVVMFSAMWGTDDYLSFAASIAMLTCGVIYIILAMTPCYSSSKNSDSVLKSLVIDDALTTNFGIIAMVVQLLSVAVGLYLAIMGAMNLYHSVHQDNPNVGTIFNEAYAVLFGVLVLISALRIESLSLKFGFITSYVGKGFFYLFIGLYFVGVTGKVDWKDQVSVLTFLCPIIISANGLFYILLWFLPMEKCGGCCKSGARGEKSYVDAI